MTYDPKSTKGAPPESPARDIPAASEAAPFMVFAELFHNGVERVADMQKGALDLAVNQTSEALTAWKRAFAVPASTPGLALMDVVDQGIEKMAEAQKGVIDLAVEQSAQALDLAKERRDYASKWMAGSRDMVCATAERTVAAQKIWLDFAAEQNKVVAETAKKQAGVAGSAAAVEAVDTVKRHVETAIKGQKELMEAVTKPFKAAKTAA